MPGVLRYTVDRLLKHAENCVALGLPALALFPAIDKKLKSADGREPTNRRGLIPRAAAALKKRFPGLGIITDAALDPYTTHGHDGLLDQSGYIMNDQTVAVFRNRHSFALKRASISLRHQTCGRPVGGIRAALDEGGFPHTPYPRLTRRNTPQFLWTFRDAVGSAKQLGQSSKSRTNMDAANSDESLGSWLSTCRRRRHGDVKPGLPYLDIVRRVRTR